MICRSRFHLTILLIEHDMKLVMGVCEADHRAGLRQDDRFGTTGGNSEEFDGYHRVSWRIRQTGVTLETAWQPILPKMAWFKREYAMKSNRKILGVALSLVIASGCMMGCERSGPSTAYDPQLDGVLPADKASPDLSILDNQKTAYDKLHEVSAAAAPKPAASVPATAPAATAPATPPA